MRKIVNIVRGDKTFQNRFLYCEVVNGEGELLCSSTVDFVLSMYEPSEISNYRETLKIFLRFYNDLMREIPT